MSFGVVRNAHKPSFPVGETRKDDVVTVRLGSVDVDFDIEGACLPGANI